MRFCALLFFLTMLLSNQAKLCAQNFEWSTHFNGSGVTSLYGAKKGSCFISAGGRDTIITESDTFFLRSNNIFTIKFDNRGKSQFLIEGVGGKIEPDSVEDLWIRKSGNVDTLFLTNGPLPISKNSSQILFAKLDTNGAYQGKNFTMPKSISNLFSSFSYTLGEKFYNFYYSVNNNKFRNFLLTSFNDSGILRDSMRILDFTIPSRTSGLLEYNSVNNKLYFFGLANRGKIQSTALTGPQVLLELDSNLNLNKTNNFNLKDEIVKYNNGARPG